MSLEPTTQPELSIALPASRFTLLAQSHAGSPCQSPVVPPFHPSDHSVLPASLLISSPSLFGRSLKYVRVHSPKQDPTGDLPPHCEGWAFPLTSRLLPSAQLIIAGTPLMPSEPLLLQKLLARSWAESFMKIQADNASQTALTHPLTHRLPDHMLETYFFSPGYSMPFSSLRANDLFTFRKPQALAPWLNLEFSPKNPGNFFESGVTQRPCRTNTAGMIYGAISKGLTSMHDEQASLTSPFLIKTDVLHH